MHVRILGGSFYHREGPLPAKRCQQMTICWIPPSVHWPVSSKCSEDAGWIGQPQGQHAWCWNHVTLSTMIQVPGAFTDSLQPSTSTWYLIAVIAIAYPPPPASTRPNHHDVGTCISRPTGSRQKGHSWKLTPSPTTSDKYRGNPKVDLNRDISRFFCASRFQWLILPSREPTKRPSNFAVWAWQWHFGHGLASDRKMHKYTPTPRSPADCKGSCRWFPPVDRCNRNWNRNGNSGNTEHTFSYFFLFLHSAFCRLGNFELGDLKSHLMNISIRCSYWECENCSALRPTKCWHPHAQGILVMAHWMPGGHHIANTTQARGKTVTSTTIEL